MKKLVSEIGGHVDRLQWQSLGVASVDDHGHQLGEFRWNEISKFDGRRPYPFDGERQMVLPVYREVRSALALKIGLGNKGRDAPAPAVMPEPSPPAVAAPKAPRKARPPKAIAVPEGGLIGNGIGIPLAISS